MAKQKLRPINDTRGPGGKFTSETAFRLYCRKGGLARARQQARDGYPNLVIGRVKSLIVRRLKAHCCSCSDSCATFRSEIVGLLASLREQSAQQLEPAARRLVG